MEVVWIGLSLLAVVLLAAVFVYGKKDGIATERSIYYEKKIERPPFEGKKILVIADEFVGDIMRFVPSIAESLGIKDLVVATVGSPDSTLKDNLQNLDSDARAYKYSKAGADGWTDCADVSLSYAIDNEEWDLVLLSQSLSEAADYSTYQPYLNALVSALKSRLNGVRFGFVATWVNCDEDYSAICSVMTEHIERDFTFEFVIPIATAIQNARAIVGDRLCDDNARLSDKGSYLAGLTIVKEIFGVSFNNLTYSPEGVDRDVVDAFVKAVCAAYENPYKVSFSAKSNGEIKEQSAR